MIYLCNNGSVYYDVSLVPKGELDSAIVVDKLPVAEDRSGYIAVMKFDTETKDIWYEYEKIPKTAEDKIKELETALMEMSTLQAMKDIENEQAIMELTMMIGGM